MVLGSAAVITVAIWLYLLTARGGFWRMPYSPQEGEPRIPAPRITAVIPARNEAAVVPRAIVSLAKQQYPGEFRMVLVDDDSQDGTASAARRVAPEGLLTVIRALPLEDGWSGKLWAVAEGIRHAEKRAPDYYLLTDADIVHPWDNLAKLVLRAESGGYSMVSYMATLECRTLAERALIPAFVWFFFLLYPPAWTRSTRRGTAGAAGGCILIRRTALEAMGGIAAIRGNLIDDCALASAVKDNGGRVWLGLNPGLRSIREYSTFGEVGGMISRSAFTQLRHSTLLLAGTVAGLAITYLAPPLLAMGGMFGLGYPAALGAFSWVLMSIAYLPILRYYRRSGLWAPLLPLVAAFYLGATIHSAVAHWSGRGGMWKGRIAPAA